MKKHRAVSKILFVHSVLNAGGSTRVAIDDTMSLLAAGFAVSFASENGPFAEELMDANIRFHRLYFVNPERYSRFIRYVIGIPVTTMLLLWFVWQTKYDCLYVQHRQSGLPSVIVSWLTGVKYVFISHSELGKFNRGRWITPLGKHIIAVSNRVKENIMNNFHVPSRNIIVIPNAVRT